MCWVCVLCVGALLPPGLAAQHTHAGHVDAYEPPRHQVLEGSQSAHKSVRVGAAGVPVPRIDAQTPGAAGWRGVTRGLEEVLLLVHVVDADVGQHRHLVVGYVHSSGLVAHPDADALAHRVKSAVLRQLGSPPAPLSGAVRAAGRLRGRRVGAEEHPGRQVAALAEQLGVHSGDGAGLVFQTPLLCRPGRGMGT